MKATPSIATPEVFTTSMVRTEGLLPVTTSGLKFLLSARLADWLLSVAVATCVL